MERARKVDVIFGILFSILALIFAAFYITGIVQQYISSYMSLIYMVFFMSMALIFTGGYNKEAGNTFSKHFFFLLGFAVLVASIVMFALGVSNGTIELFKFGF